MKNLKVVKVGEDSIEFDNGLVLCSDHAQDCCEHHWISFEDLDIDDFEGLEFDLTTDTFFERVEGYGIRLIPNGGHPVSVAGYGVNNGYYSSELDLVISEEGKILKVFDISECQEVSD